MTTDQLQSLWAEQTPAELPLPDFAVTQRRLTRELRRRRRMIGYEIFCAAFVLIFFPLLSWGNLRYAPSLAGPIFWLSAGAHVLGFGVLLIYAVRKHWRHARVMRQRTENLRDQTGVAIAALEEEARDLRCTPWVLVLLTGLVALSIWTNRPFHGWTPETVGWRLGGSLLVYALFGLFAWLKYHRRVLPALREQQEIQAQLA